MKKQFKDKVRFSRFADLQWLSKVCNDKQEPNHVLVGGCGGIGSWLSLLLARMGISPIIYDGDIVEAHNISGQLMKTRHNGNAKVQGIAETIYEYTGEHNYFIFNEMINENTPSMSWVFSAFDNMKARTNLFENWVAANKGDKEALFVDGRLQVEAFEILCVRGDDNDAIERYRDIYLFPDSDVPDAPCSAKQTSHMAAVIAGLMVGFFTNHLTNLAEDDDIAEVPFFTDYHLLINNFNSNAPIS